MYTMLITLVIRKRLTGIILLLLTCGGLFYIYTRDDTLPVGISKMEFRAVIDAGHGSVDSGTSYGSILEKDINLQIANLLYQELRQVNIVPIMTRTEDKLYKDSRRKDIAHRPEIARKNQADIMISIHANYFPSSQPSGSQLFYKPGSEESKALAEMIQAELIKLRQENDRSIKSGDFYVLNQTPCPAVLIEVGFLSNPGDRRWLTNNTYQRKMASAINTGVINYFQSHFDQKARPDKPVSNILVFQPIENNSLYFLQEAGGQITLVPIKLAYYAHQPVSRADRIKQLEDWAYRAVKQLLEPPDGLISPLPAGTEIRLVSLKADKLTIDFTATVRENFSGGAGLEEYAIEALSKTIFSLPGINQLEILVEGEKDTSIGGHIILNQAIQKR